MTETESCRHEYVKIIQRRLKGLERRLVATRAYLPVGFKQADLAHLSEGSFCFCTKCRARLYPRRTQAEKLKARIAAQEAKMAQLETSESPLDNETTQVIDVEELELEATEVADINTDGIPVDEPVESLDALSDEDL
ncbi:MAG: hypothetical protein K2Y22_01540 [Candidatus Obscuribacterales bacterium]|nr:hypothetical protein [Candidatus Obscuribacterales bacterium]